MECRSEWRVSVILKVRGKEMIVGTRIEVILLFRHKSHFCIGGDIDLIC